jgi:predicted amidohydrolase YtcJ
MWSQNAALNERFNGGAYKNQPLFLRGMDGHTGWSNAALRKRAGLNKAFIAKLPEEKRKYYGVDKDLTPNGFGVDEGLDIIEKKIPPADAKKTLAGARAAVEYLHSIGITSWLDPLVDAATLTAYRDLAAAGGLTAHVAALPLVKPDDPESFKNALALREKFKGIPNLTLPGFKVFADGVVEYPSQSAAMTAPYSNTGKKGDLLFKPENFAKLCIDADKLGLFVHTHAIGDLAVHEALNGYAGKHHAPPVRAGGRFRAIQTAQRFRLVPAFVGVVWVRLGRSHQALRRCGHLAVAVPGALHAGRRSGDRRRQRLARLHT